MIRSRSASSRTPCWLGAVDLRRAFRPRLARRPLAVAGLGVATSTLLVAWPNPQDDVIAQRRAAREAAERVAERVEDVADQVSEENVDNPNPRRRKLERQLTWLARQLRERGADRRGDAGQDWLRPGLSRMTDPQAAERDAGLTQLARSTSRAATGEGEANEERSGASGQRSGGSRRAMPDLDREEASPVPRTAELRRAAQAGAATQPQVSPRRGGGRARRGGPIRGRERTGRPRPMRWAARQKPSVRVSRIVSSGDIARAQSAPSRGRTAGRAGRAAGRRPARGLGTARAHRASRGGSPADPGQPGGSGRPRGLGTARRIGPAGQQPGGSPWQPARQLQPRNQPGSQPGQGGQLGSGGGTFVRRMRRRPADGRLRRPEPRQPGLRGRRPTGRPHRLRSVRETRRPGLHRRRRRQRRDRPDRLPDRASASTATAWCRTHRSSTCSTTTRSRRLIASRCRSR